MRLDRPTLRAFAALAFLLIGLALTGCAPPPPEADCTLTQSTSEGDVFACGPGVATFTVTSSYGFGGQVYAPGGAPDVFEDRWTLGSSSGACTATAGTADGERFFVADCPGTVTVSVVLPVAADVGIGPAYGVGTVEVDA